MFILFRILDAGLGAGLALFLYPADRTAADAVLVPHTQQPATDRGSRNHTAQPPRRPRDEHSRQPRRGQGVQGIIRGDMHVMSGSRWQAGRIDWSVSVTGRCRGPTRAGRPAGAPTTPATPSPRRPASLLEGPGATAGGPTQGWSGGARDLVSQHEHFDVLRGGVRPTSKPSLSTCGKSRYSSRSDTATIMPDHRRPPITAARQRARRSGTPHRPGRGGAGPCSSRQFRHVQHRRVLHLCSTSARQRIHVLTM